MFWRLMSNLYQNLQILLWVLKLIYAITINFNSSLQYSGI